MRPSDAVNNAAIDAAVDLIDAGTTNTFGKIEFYTGTPPANVGDAPGETLLASVNFQDPAFGDAASAEATANGTPITTTGDDDGDIGWARILDRDETALWDEDDVGTSGNAITVNTVTVSSGVDVELTSYTFNSKGTGQS